MGKKSKQGIVGVYITALITYKTPFVVNRQPMQKDAEIIPTIKIYLISVE